MSVKPPPERPHFAIGFLAAEKFCYVSHYRTGAQNYSELFPAFDLCHMHFHICMSYL